MDASLTGEYAPLMHFINGLERSKTFFLISGLTLTGQQGGTVNLRLRLNTYLHASNTRTNSFPWFKVMFRVMKGPLRGRIPTDGAQGRYRR